AWVVLPPGTGKTLVGLEAARRLGRRTVVLVPNTAIQNQWVDHWRRCGGEAGTDRELTHPVTVLTYQSLAVFDPDAETDEEGHTKQRKGGLVRLLHDNGRALVAALHDAGPLTLVLDECHHLLDVWGRLLAEILEELPDARVIGLTATPPESLTPDEAKLVDALFGVPILGASIPAMVRQGYLAPFAELAWLTTPTAVEADYVAGEAERFKELTAGLLEPGFTSTGLLEWLDARMIDRTSVEGGAVSWARVEAAEPKVAAAALRFHHAGLLELPPGARVREEHRHEPTAEDWVALLNDYVVHCLLPSENDKDAEALEAMKRALPAVGYQLTKRGIRAARSPVDRVLARSAAKTHGAVEIAALEAVSLGSRLRCLVLCD
ncbi:DEAD/DEAH box helicase, partial [Actinomadura adrarensis]